MPSALFSWAPKSLQMVTAAMKLKDTRSWKKSYDKPRQLIKKTETSLCRQRSFSQSNGFSSSHVWMWELDCEESWVLKNWCFWIVMLEKTLESPLHSKEIKAGNPKGSQPWVFIGKTDAETEAQYFGHLMWRGESLEKTLMLGKIEGRRRRRQQRTEERRHYWLNGHEFEQASGYGEGKGSLACCSPWDHKESDVTE